MTGNMGRSSMWRRAGVIGAVGLAGIVVARKRAAPSRMPHALTFERTLSETRGDAEARRLIAAAEARYRASRETSPAPASLALRLHLRFLLLPGLAMYQTLIEAGEDRRTAVDCMESLMAASVKPSLGFFRLFRLVPGSFGLFRAMAPLVIRLGFPARGWEIEPREDSADAYAFVVRRCFYLDTLTARGAPELTPVFCGGDDLMFPALEPAVIWKRTGTLGRGQDRCDFCWSRGVGGARALPPQHRAAKQGE